MKGIKVCLILVVGTMLAGCGLLPEIPVSPPTEVPTVFASFGEFPYSIRLAWQSVPGATTYKIFRTQNPEEAYTQIAEVPTLAYSDGVGEENQGKWYWYKVRACNAAGCGPESQAVWGYAGRPPAPQNVRASQGDHPDYIKIEWDSIPGATDYQVFRDLVRDGTYRTPVATGITATSVEDRDVRPGTWYWYRIRACNSHGCSELSEAAAGYCGTRPIPFSSDEQMD